MRKLFAVSLVILLSMVGIADAKRKTGKLSVSAGVSVYNPPGSASSTLLFEVNARYNMTDKITGELSVGWTQYKSGGENVTLMPIQLNGEFHPLGRGMFDPFIGAGTGVYLSQVGDKTDATVGIQTTAGLSFRPASGFGFTAEVKYMLQDITDSKSGGLSFGGGIEGSWQTEL